MTYLPTQEDLALLTNRSKDILCRIELLDKNYSVVDCIDGLALNGSGSVDADSDTRRTYNLTLHPKSNSIVADYAVEDWVNKMVRIYVGLRAPSLEPFSSLDKDDEAIDQKVRASEAYIDAVDYYNRVITKLKTQGLDRYGNIDNINRNRIWWTKENLEKYAEYVNDHSTIRAGAYSTALPAVLDNVNVLNGASVACSTLFHTAEKIIPLQNSVVVEYFDKIVENAKVLNNDEITISGLLRADGIGAEIEVYGEKMTVHNLFAAIEGQTFNNRILTAVDIYAIADWSQDDLLEKFGKSSSFVGNSLHDIHYRVWDARDGIDETYDYMWLQLTGFPKGDRTVSAISGLSSGYIDTSGVHWYSQGVYAIKDNGFVYDATTNTMSISCTDLTAMLDGTLGGSLIGYATKIYKYDRKLDKDGYPVEDTDSPVLIHDAIDATFKLSGLSKCMIDYWKRYIPHDMEYGTGATVWEILSELRDLYFPFEMYFDDNTFVCKEIPSGIGDPAVMDADLFSSLVISENANVDYTQIHNCVEVWGATIESDAYCQGEVSEDDPDGTGYVYYAAKDDLLETGSESEGKVSGFNNDISDENQNGRAASKSITGTIGSIISPIDYKKLASVLKWEKVKSILQTHNLDTSNMGSAIILLQMKNIMISGGIKISFYCPVDLKGSDVRIVLYDEVVTETVDDKGNAGQTIETYVYGPMKIYSAMTDKNGNDVLQDLSALKQGKYYVLQYGEYIINKEKDDTLYSNKESRIYFLGQSQSHAMVKFVDIMPTEAEIAQDKVTENCDNLKYVVVNDPTDLTGLYNSRFTIDQIGRRNEILSGGEYDNYTTDESALEVAEYMLWKGCRLVDTITLNMVLVPWFNVNEKVKYAAKYLKSNIPVEWIIKKIDINLGEGTMNMTLSRYYPYYPYIVSEKYDD